LGHAPCRWELRFRDLLKRRRIIGSYLDQDLDIVFVRSFAY